MQVTLASISMPVVKGVHTPEDFVAYAARVSNPDNQMNTATTPKLLAYLVRNRHWSPFEMVSLVMEINTTRDIARQILRHRSFSFQEFSQRYASVESLGFSVRECRLQDNKNRQNSIEVEDRELANMWEDKQLELLVHVKALYKWALDNGIAKEVARAVLPEGMTGSKLYMSGTLRSWIHYIQERTYIGTQKEHRCLGEQAKVIVTDLFPSISEILDANTVK